MTAYEKIIRYNYGLIIGILLEYLIRINSKEVFSWVCLAFCLLIVIVDLFNSNKTRHDNKR